MPLCQRLPRRTFGRGLCSPLGLASREGPGTAARSGRPTHRSGDTAHLAQRRCAGCLSTNAVRCHYRAIGPGSGDAAWLCGIYGSVLGRSATCRSGGKRGEPPSLRKRRDRVGCPSARIRSSPISFEAISTSGRRHLRQACDHWDPCYEAAPSDERAFLSAQVARLSREPDQHHAPVIARCVLNPGEARALVRAGLADEVVANFDGFWLRLMVRRAAS